MIEDLIHLSLHTATDLAMNLTAAVRMSLKRQIILVKAPWAQCQQCFFTKKKGGGSKVKEPRKILLYFSIILYPFLRPFGEAVFGLPAQSFSSLTLTGVNQCFPWGLSPRTIFSCF